MQEVFGPEIFRIFQCLSAKLLFFPVGHGRKSPDSSTIFQTGVLLSVFIDFPPVSVVSRGRNHPPGYFMIEIMATAADDVVLASLGGVCLTKNRTCRQVSNDNAALCFITAHKIGCCVFVGHIRYKQSVPKVMITL
jgi:hypothetical protein